MIYVDSSVALAHLLTESRRPPTTDHPVGKLTRGKPIDRVRDLDSAPCIQSHEVSW